MKIKLWIHRREVRTEGRDEPGTQNKANGCAFNKRKTDCEVKWRKEEKSSTPSI